MDSDASGFIETTRRQALYLWAGLSLALTLFYVQSQIIFVKGDPLPTSQLEWIFACLGAATFLMGYFFFKNYTKLRKPKLMRMPFKDRKQSLLIAFVLQFILFETLGLYGVLLSVLTRNSWKAAPYILFAYIGFYTAFPRRKSVADFFMDSES